MKKKIQKWLCVVLAVLVLLPTVPLIAGAVSPSEGSASVQSSTQSPLKVEIQSDKAKYTLLGKMEFTATITNIGSETIENISAVAQLGKDLRPLKGSQLTATKASLAPNESFSFKYYADLKGLKSLDNLLLPFFWASSLFHGGKMDVTTNNLDGEFVETNKAIGLVSAFAGLYDVSTGVRVYIGDGSTIDIPDGENPKGVVYVDGVIEISTQIKYQQNGSKFTFPITEETKKLKAGVVFLLPDKTPYKVVKVHEENGSYTIETEEPLIEETVDSINIKGKQTLDIQDFIPADGVEILQQSQVQSQGLRSPRQNSGVPYFEAKTKLDEDTELYAKISFNEIGVDFNADIDIDWFNFYCKDVYLKVFFEAEVTGGITFLKEDGSTKPKGGVATLGKIPVLGFPGIAIYVEVAIAYDFTGKFEIKINTDGEIGFQVNENHPYGIGKINASYSLTKFEASIRVGPQISGLLEICNKWDLIDFAFFCGGQAKGKIVMNNKLCTDVNSFLFAQLKALDKGVIGKWLDIGYKWDIWDENNSPLKRNFHFENFNLVPECTIEENNIRFGEFTATVLDDENKPLAGVDVKALDITNKVIAECTTDSTGKAYFLLPVGEYTIVYSKEGYRTDTYSETITYDVPLVYDSIWLSKLGGGQFTTAPMIAAGARHLAILKSDGTVWTWGQNGWSQLGDGTTTDRGTPVQVQGLHDITAVAAGLDHTLALQSDGTVWAWGNNQYGQLGDGTNISRSIPVQVQGLSDVTAIVAGTLHISGAIKSDGTLLTWGHNLKGQLGDGTTTDKNTPVQVQGLSDVIAIAIGDFHAGALKNDGTVWVWGDNEYSQLDGSTNTSSLIPIQVQGLNGMTAIVAGQYHTATLKNDGTVWTWGTNYFSPLDGTIWPGKSTPKQMNNMNDVTALASGSNHMVALKSDSTVWTWGSDDRGQLSNSIDTYAGRSIRPGQIADLNGVTSIVAGDGCTAVLKSDGSVWILGEIHWSFKTPTPIRGENGVEYFNVN